jgi:hypothetical protein
MAAGRSPSVKSRRRQIVNPDIGLAVRMRCARMQTSALGGSSSAGGNAEIMSIAQVVVQSTEQVETSSTELLSSQVLSPSLVVNRPLRLRLSPSIGKGALDGAWWPYSHDLSAEALDLVDHFPASFDRIRRVVYSTPDWDAAPRRIKAADVFVSLASFPRDDTHRVFVEKCGRVPPSCSSAARGAA